MTNVQKLSELQNRLTVLQNRYEKLVELNSIRNYVSMILTDNGLESNPKTTKYLSVLLEIKKQKQILWLQRRDLSKTYAIQLEVVKQNISTVTMTKQMMFNLTSPSYDQY